MIFSSNAFIFAFLPIALIGYYLIARLGPRAANGWLVAASLTFYAYWNPSFLAVLLCSIAWNYGMAAWIFRFGEERSQQKFLVLWAAIIGNLLLLAYYKYLFPIIGFMAAHHIVPASWEAHVLLPLGISFFTFTQIGYLVDSYDGRAKDRSLLSYMLFVTFFPHLIAGPILHNREIMPQFADPETKRLKAENLSVGIAIFAIGMGKKVLLGDPLGFSADHGFANADTLSTTGAWLTVLAYSLQLYFDFSGYSDMAIGIARMFGIIFPVNFNSPYKAASIIDFWSRWHMTLTRYLTLYLYNPVAMAVSRRRMAKGLGTSRKATRNLPAFLSLIVLPNFFTMGLAGIWHGAGLQFLIFGLLHAAYLSINHGWRMFGPQHLAPAGWRTALFVVLTYSCVLVGQIFFRAESVGDAMTFLAAMIGQASGSDSFAGSETRLALRILLGFVICFTLPNTQQIMRNFRPILEQVSVPQRMTLAWRTSPAWSVSIGVLLLCALMRMSDVSKFLYFQF